MRYANQVQVKTTSAKNWYMVYYIKRVQFHICQLRKLQKGVEDCWIFWETFLFFYT